MLLLCAWACPRHVLERLTVLVCGLIPTSVAYERQGGPVPHCDSSESKGKTKAQLGTMPTPPLQSHSSTTEPLLSELWGPQALPAPPSPLNLGQAVGRSSPLSGALWYQLTVFRAPVWRGSLSLRSRAVYEEWRCLVRGNPVGQWSLGSYRKWRHLSCQEPARHKSGVFSVVGSLRVGRNPG